MRRSIHHLPPLPNDFREGVPGLLSAEGFDMAWTQYMTLMLDKLNALTAGE
jgi:superoxide dismutase, Fe-Mn family